MNTGGQGAASGQAGSGAARKKGKLRLRDAGPSSNHPASAPSPDGPAEQCVGCVSGRSSKGDSAGPLRAHWRSAAAHPLFGVSSGTTGQVVVVVVVMV